MSRLSVQVLLNKGREGISLHRLPRLLSEIQKFLDSLTEDTVGQRTEWLGFEFYNSSLGYTARSEIEVAKEQAEDFQLCLKGVINRSPDPKLRDSTLAQYANIAEPISDEDTVSFGIPTAGAAAEESEEIAGDRVEWLDFDKASALSLVSGIQLEVKSIGGVQGVVHSLYLGSKPPHFQLRELSTTVLIKCEYDESKHQEIVHAIERPNAVIIVHGLIHTNLKTRKISKIEVSRIEPAATLSGDELQKLIGSFQARLQGQIDEPDLQGIINRMRGRG